MGTVPLSQVLSRSPAAIPPHLLHLVYPHGEILHKLIDVIHQPQGQVLCRRRGRSAHARPVAPESRAGRHRGGHCPQGDTPHDQRGSAGSGGTVWPPLPGAPHRGGCRQRASVLPRPARRTQTSVGTREIPLHPSTAPWAAPSPRSVPVLIPRYGHTALYLLPLLKHPEEGGHGPDVQRMRGHGHDVVEQPGYLRKEDWGQRGRRGVSTSSPPGEGERGQSPQKAESYQPSGAQAGAGGHAEALQGRVGPPSPRIH